MPKVTPLLAQNGAEFAEIGPNFIPCASPGASVSGLLGGAENRVFRDPQGVHSKFSSEVIFSANGAYLEPSGSQNGPESEPTDAEFAKSATANEECTKLTEHVSDLA